MRFSRPTPKASLVAAGLVAALVVGGSAGAVAGGLVTSKDIKDGTVKTRDLKDDSVTAHKLAPGAVSWDKSLDQATKDAIEALVAEPVPGPQGETGPQGPAGAPGGRGSQGESGDGSYVAGGIFGTNGYSASDTDFDVSELYPASGDGIELTTPGNYLVSVQGVFGFDEDSDLLAAPFVFLGEPVDPATFFLNACTPSTDYFFPMCTTTFPLTVHADETVDLPVLVPSGTSVGCTEVCESPAVVRVAIYRQGGEVTDDLDVPDDAICLPVCGTEPLSSGTALSKSAKRYVRSHF